MANLVLDLFGKDYRPAFRRIEVPTLMIVAGTAPAISFVVYCESQEEVDELWEKPSAGGREDQCAWLQDK